MKSQEIKNLIEAYSSIYESNCGSEMEEGGEKGEKEEYKGKKKGKKEKVDESEMEESVDLFDYILEHLVAEGYADTEESALAIMANMSEDWRQSIVEGVFDFLPKNKVVVPGVYGKNTVLAKKGGVEGVADKSKPGSFTPQKGGWDSMDANRYSDERIKQGHSTGGVNLADRRVTPNRIK
jgi:hypothetical protein